jgi:TrmH family RNA methyltransferase
LLTAGQRDRFLVVLVSPRNPLNIGAAARAMANFAFANLAVVSPYAPHWREARSAIGAPQILRSAVECTSLADAVAGCSLVLGTAAVAHRTPQQPVVPLPALPSRLAREIERRGRIAIVFGPEKRGLTRDDLSHCHLLVEIPASPQQPSMNLGQAVAVCLYELAVRTFDPGHPASVSARQESETSGSDNHSVSSATLDLLAGLVDEAIEASNYSPPEMRQANRHDLRLLLRRLALTERDARRILGLFRRIIRRLKL